MNNLSPFHRDVPILGEPLKIVAHWPTAIVQCQCEAKTTVVIIGARVVVGCPACQKQYAIVDDMAVRVGLVAQNQPVGVLQ